jgi:hypothetical protein
MSSIININTANDILAVYCIDDGNTSNYSGDIASFVSNIVKHSSEHNADIIRTVLHTAGYDDEVVPMSLTPIEESVNSRMQRRSLQDNEYYKKRTSMLSLKSGHVEPITICASNPSSVSSDRRRRFIMHLSACFKCS